MAPGDVAPFRIARLMLLDLSPLRRHRDFRLLFAGQFVSAMGSFLTYAALPVPQRLANRMAE